MTLAVRLLLPLCFIAAAALNADSQPCQAAEDDSAALLLAADEARWPGQETIPGLPSALLRPVVLSAENLPPDLPALSALDIAPEQRSLSPPSA